MNFIVFKENKELIAEVSRLLYKAVNIKNLLRRHLSTNKKL